MKCLQERSYLYSILKKTDGFTLLEVLIALAILAIALVAMYTAQGNSLLMNGASDDLTVATFLANQQMTEFTLEIEDNLAKKKGLDDKEETGDFDPPYDAFHWIRRVRKVQIPIVLPEGGDDAQDMIMGQAKGVLEQVSKAVREVSVTIFWGAETFDKDSDAESYVLTTHLVDMAAVKIPGAASTGDDKSQDTSGNTNDTGNTGASETRETANEN